MAAGLDGQGWLLTKRKGLTAVGHYCGSFGV